MYRVATLIVVCGLGTGCEQLLATVSATVVLTKTPNLSSTSTIPAPLLAVLPLDAIGDEGTTAVFSAVGERSSVTSTDAPDPISGAQIDLEFDGDLVALCAASAAGTYRATSVLADSCGRSALVYTAGETYIASIETADELYTITFDAPPPVTSNLVTFEPAFTVPQNNLGVSIAEHSADDDLLVDWSAAGNDDPAFVTLFRVNYVGSSSDTNGALAASNWETEANNPVFDNFPKDAGDFLDLVFDTSHETELTIPAARFSETGLYILIVTPARISQDVSNNLSLGSGAVAGQGTAFGFWVD